jgi:hypothetical protein
MAHVVSKLTRLDRAKEEKERYISHISGKLGAATFADLTDEVVAACGGSAGLFYSVADTFTKDLFAVLADDAETASHGVVYFGSVNHLVRDQRVVLYVRRFRVSVSTIPVWRVVKQRVPSLR